jgi:glucokinase
MSTSKNFYIGLDVGRTIRAALVDATGRIVRRRKLLSEVRDPRALISQLVETINGLKAEEGCSVAAGIGWPGLVNRRENRLEVTPNMLDVSSFDVHGELLEATGLPVVFDNDANAGAYGEWCCGAARGHADVFFVTMEIGRAHV